jgi:hypothetical protein
LGEDGLDLGQIRVLGWGDDGGRDLNDGFAGIIDHRWGRVCGWLDSLGGLGLRARRGDGSDGEACELLGVGWVGDPGRARVFEDLAQGPRGGVAAHQGEVAVAGLEGAAQDAEVLSGDEVAIQDRWGGLVAEEF